MSWVFYTITAALLQTFRNLEQKNLNKKLDGLTVSWSRFIGPFPLSIGLVCYTYSQVSPGFILICFITAASQILGNLCLLKTFKSRNFSIGIAFYKTETLQALLIGILCFKDSIPINGILAIIVTTIGIGCLSQLNFKSRKTLTQSFKNTSVIYGLLTGFSFSISAFTLKHACTLLSPAGHNPIKTALIVLLWVIFFQNLLFISIKTHQKRLKEDLLALINAENKYSALKTTALSFFASICWFTAYGMGNVVYVKAIGQIELVFAIVASHFLLKEKLKRVELIGILLIILGILWLIYQK